MFRQYNLSYAENNYSYQQAPSFISSYPVSQADVYQENINKCLISVNNDYNSYDASDYDSLHSSTSVIIDNKKNLRDSGNASGSFEKSSLIKEKIHTHETIDDQDDCGLCRMTTAYLLSVPFINHLDYMFPVIRTNGTEEVRYEEYKLFDKFNFPKKKRISVKQTLFNFYGINPWLMMQSVYEIQKEFESNGKKVGRLDPMHENDVPMTPRFDYRNGLFEFQPAANSTPSKFLLTQHVDTYQQFASSTVYCWKKPIVLDPRLSANYDAVFPPLEVSANFKYQKQPSVNEVDNFQINYCVFCKNNEQPPEIYMSHVLRDFTGRICCPNLRKYKCPRCGASGDTAHTNKYCPKNPKSKLHAKAYSFNFTY